MERPLQQDITELLDALRAGDRDAESRLLTVVYRQLRDLAARLMRGERRDHTLQPSALVNEAYIRMMGFARPDCKNRAHFFGLAAQAMRHVLTDYARKRLTRKRGAGVAPIAVDEVFVIAQDRLEEVLILDEALERLGKHDPRALQVVVFRIFGGLSIDEIVEVLKTSPRTVKRDWQYGQAWLKAELTPGTANGARRT